MKLLLPIIVAILIAGYFLVGQSLIPKKTTPDVSSSPTPITQELKTFQSKFMKFSIDLPSNFSATDEPSRITIHGDEGQIYVNRNGTQFNDLDTYLANFDQATKTKISLDEKLVINYYEARERISSNPDIGIEKTYFIYVENFVYKISTTSQSLYDELDQIAQSFRYTP